MGTKRALQKEAHAKSQDFSDAVPIRQSDRTHDCLICIGWMQERVDLRCEESVTVGVSKRVAGPRDPAASCQDRRKCQLRSCDARSGIG
jgi:hypothetical protein